MRARPELPVSPTPYASYLYCPMCGAILHMTRQEDMGKEWPERHEWELRSAVIEHLADRHRVWLRLHRWLGVPIPGRVHAALH